MGLLAGVDHTGSGCWYPVTNAEDVAEEAVDCDRYVIAACVSVGTCSRDLVGELGTSGPRTVVLVAHWDWPPVHEAARVSEKVPDQCRGQHGDENRVRDGGHEDHEGGTDQPGY